MTPRKASSRYSRSNDSEKFRAAMLAMRRTMPAGFAEKARYMGDTALCRLYKAGHSTVARWRKECGVAGRIREGKMPRNFPADARGMTVKEAARHFERDTRTIRRWFTYAGITPKAERVVIGRPVKRAEMDSSMPALAAHHLRRFYGSVHRADIRMKENDRMTWGDQKGLPDGGRGLYFVAGLGAIPDYEMIAIARDHGFRESFL